MNNDAPRPNTAQEMVEVIAAHDSGKSLESRRHSSSDSYSRAFQWSPDSEPNFNFGVRQYRVALASGYAVVTAKGRLVYAHALERKALAMAERVGGNVSVVPVREVRGN